MSTTRCANKSLHWVFKGRRERTGQCKRNTALPATSPFRRAIRFQGHAMLLKRKENSSQDSRQRPQFRLCCHSISTFWFRNINLIPFRQAVPSEEGTTFKKNSPISQDRLTHVQLLFTWNLSPLQSSKFSFEYLLLLPRSALESASSRLAPRNAPQTPRPPTQHDVVFVILVEYK